MDKRCSSCGLRRLVLSRSRLPGYWADVVPAPPRSQLAFARVAPHRLRAFGVDWSDNRCRCDLGVETDRNTLCACDACAGGAARGVVLSRVFHEPTGPNLPSQYRGIAALLPVARFDTGLDHRRAGIRALPLLWLAVSAHTGFAFAYPVTCLIEPRICGLSR